MNRWVKGWPVAGPTQVALLATVGAAFVIFALIHLLATDFRQAADQGAFGLICLANAVEMQARRIEHGLKGAPL